MTKPQDYFWPLNSHGRLLNRLLNSSGDTKFEKKYIFENQCYACDPTIDKTA